MVFSETVLDHFQAPRNVGELEHPDGAAEDENPVCGDRLRLQLRIRDGTIEAVRWRAEGCAPAIAAASVASELLEGMRTNEARGVNRDVLTDALGGLPPRKAHAAALVASAIRKALDSYETSGGH
ncbi:MAG TPA: iron-sulfur cluster assembly scaffold protein [Chloroflexota bacterium]